MPSLRSAWVWIDMSPNLSANDADPTISKPCVAGTIKVVRVGQKLLGAAGSASFTLSKNAVNVLSAASVDCQADLVAGVAEDVALSTAPSSLQVTDTDMLHAVYTFTTCSMTSAVGVMVAIEPSVW